MTAIDTLAESIETVLAKVNGKRRVRIADMGSVLWMIRKLLTTGEVEPITHEVANSYGYSSEGTYVAVKRKTTGEVVLGVWRAGTNRAGRLPGVTARNADKVQEQIDAIQPVLMVNGQVWVLDLESAIALASRDETESAILRELAGNPWDVATFSAWKDYCTENNFN